MRKILTLALAVATAFIVVSCGGSHDSQVAAEPEAPVTTDDQPKRAEPEEAEAEQEKAEPEDAELETCSLSVERIGDDTMEVVGSYLIDGEDLLVLGSNPRRSVVGAWRVAGQASMTGEVSVSESGADFVEALFDEFRQGCLVSGE